MQDEIIDIKECGSPAGEGVYPGALTPFFERMKRLGRWGEIVRICLKVLDLYPEDVKTRSILAEAYLSMGFVSPAEFEIKKIRQTLKSLSDRCEELSRAFVKAGTDRIRPEEDDWEEEGPELEMPDLATPTLAELYLSQGRRQEALALYEKILASDPTNSDVTDRLAELRGELAKALQPEGPVGVSEEENGRYMIAVLEHWLERLRTASHGR
jgi:tetratricopeptide (TPR) repeat protein